MHRVDRRDAVRRNKLNLIPLNCVYILLICIYEPRYNLAVAVLPGTANKRKKRNAHGNSVYLKRINYRFALHGESVARVAFVATCYARCATILQSVVFLSFFFLFSFSFFFFFGRTRRTKVPSYRIFPCRAEPSPSRQSAHFMRDLCQTIRANVCNVIVLARHVAPGPDVKPSR